MYMLSHIPEPIKQVLRPFRAMMREVPTKHIPPQIDESGVPRKALDFETKGWFREIISDPLSTLIERHPRSGIVQDNLVYLHNGNRVGLGGDFACYKEFSDILAINREVHEPLEEFVFQVFCRDWAPRLL